MNRQERIRVRHDEPAVCSEPRTRPKPLSANRPRVWVGSRARALAWPLVLAFLSTTTSLAVAFWASIWLVPPYLALLALILGVPSASTVRVWARFAYRHGRAWGSAGKRWFAHRAAIGLTSLRRSSSSASRSEIGSGPVMAATAEIMDPGAELQSDSELDSNPGSTSAKAKRGRGRVRKARSSPVAEVTGATWVRVGPGKYVRADGRTPLPGESELVTDGTIEETQATLPGSDGSVAEEGDGGGAVLELGQVAEERLEIVSAAEVSPVVSGEVEVGDHGIAPEAPDFHALQCDLAEPPIPPDEPEPIACEPEPVAEPVLASVADPSAPEPDDLPDETPDVVFRVFPSNRRDDPDRERMADYALPGPSWPAERRYGRPIRYLRGARQPSQRQPRRVGRFAHAGRLHPPRSPPRWRPDQGRAGSSGIRS